MELRIIKCPKCGFDDFVVSTTGNATCNITYNMDDVNMKGLIGDWDFNGKMKTEVRCGNCELSLKRYIVKED